MKKGLSNYLLNKTTNLKSCNTKNRTNNLVKKGKIKGEITYRIHSLYHGPEIEAKNTCMCISNISCIKIKQYYKRISLEKFPSSQHLQVSKRKEKKNFDNLL